MLHSTNCHSGQSWASRKLRARSFSESPMWMQGFKYLSHPSSSGCSISHSAPCLLSGKAAADCSSSTYMETWKKLLTSSAFRLAQLRLLWSFGECTSRRKICPSPCFCNSVFQMQINRLVFLKSWKFRHNNECVLMK